MMGEAITFSLPGPIDSVQKERAIEWLKGKLAEAGTRFRRSTDRARRCRERLAFRGKPGTSLHPA
jgi:hypothetical protein